MTDSRIRRILDKYMAIPTKAERPVRNSFLSEKMKRSYLRIVEERTKRFIKVSE